MSRPNNDTSTNPPNIPTNAPAGGLTILQPPQTATSYFKIGPSNTVTFVWNFTDVILFPTSLTLSAVCDNGNTYPVGPSDGKIDGKATSVEWDLWAYQQANPTLPLAATSYVLHIWGDQGPGAQRQPGMLQENSALRFAMYSQPPYEPLESWTCSTCNNAWSDFAAHPATVSLMVTILVMFLSGYSLIRQATR